MPQHSNRNPRQPSQTDKSGQHLSGTPGSSRAQGRPAGNLKSPRQEGGTQSEDRGQGPRKP